MQLFGGNLATQLLYAMVLGAALHAYGESLPLLQLVLINCIASFIGGAAPVPGGMGVIETGLIAGFTASGIPEGQAVAATFTARMCTSYLPPIWGGSPCPGSARRTTSSSPAQAAMHYDLGPQGRSWFGLQQRGFDRVWSDVDGGVVMQNAWTPTPART